MLFKIIPNILTLSFSGVLATSAAATTPLLGAIGINMEAEVTGRPPGAVNVAESWSIPDGQAVRDLNVNKTAGARSGPVASSVSSAVAATWASSAKGAFKVANNGWTVVKPAAVDPGVVASAFLGPSWLYEFRADQDGTFNFDFTMAGHGNLAGLGNWTLEYSDVGSGHGTAISVGNGYANGSVMSLASSVDILQGHAYIFLLAADERTPAGFDVGLLSGAESGGLTWSISATSPGTVPEPDSWTLMVGGFGVASAVFRRRRSRSFTTSTV